MLENEEIKDNNHYLQQAIISVPQKQTVESQSYLNDIYEQPSKYITKESLIKILQLNNIVYQEDIFYEDIHIKLVTNTLNYQACSIVVYYGQFSTQMKIINVDCISPTLKMPLIGKGRYAQVYHHTYNDKQHAIKIVKYNDDQMLLLKQVIKDYFLSLIASTLGIGPSITNIYGFNLVIYENTIQYSMSFCQKVQKYPSYILSGLKQKLFKLHLLKIIHSDIKPQNICFSQSKQQLVFIDFGFSRLIKQQRGHKTLINVFNGTFNYCTKQMKNLFTEKKPNYIDLYQNDCFGLIKTLNDLLSTDQIEIQNQLYQQVLQQDDFLEKIKLFDYLLTNTRIKCKIFQLLIDPYLPNLPNQIEIYQIFKLYFLESFYFTKQMPITVILKRFISFKNIPTYQSLSQSKVDIVMCKMPMKLNHWQISTFKRRVKLLEHFQTKQLNKYQSQDNSMQFLLFNPDKIAQTETETYYLIICKFIKINGQSISMNHTIKSIKNMPQLSQRLDIYGQQQIYYEAIRTLLQFCLQPSISEKKYQILINIIETIIILQIVPQNKIKSLFMEALRYQIPLFKKLRLCFQIISCLQYTRHKYKSIYNFKQIKQFCIKNLLLSLNSKPLAITTQKQLLLCKAIILALSFQINLSIDYQKVVEEAKKLYALTLEERKFIVTQLHLYVVYNELLIDLSNSSIEDIKNSFTLLQKNYYNFKYSTVSYHLFISFMVNYYRNLNYDNYQIYNIFLKRIGAFKQHLSFKIRIYYQLQKIAQKLYMQDIYNSEKIIRKNQDKSIMEELQHISSLIMQHKIEFDQFLYDLILLLSFQRDHQYSYLLKKIITDNKHHIMFYPEQALPQNIIHHNKLLIWIRNTYLLILNGQIYGIFINQQAENLYALFYEKATQKLSQTKCFQCKLFSIIQAKILFLAKTTTQSQNKNYQTNISKLIDLAILCYKNKQLERYQPQIMLNIIWISFHYKYQLKEFLLFFYQWMNRRSSHLYILTNQSLKDIFIQMYKLIHLRLSPQQLIQFLFTISYQFVNYYSFERVHHFYSNILQLVSQYKNDLQFVSNHQSMIIEMVKRQFYSPYISVYYLALLQIKIKSPVINKVLFLISKNIDLLDVHTKYLIFSRYYYYKKFYFVHPERKQNYLQRMILKYKAGNEQGKRFNFLKRKRKKTSKYYNEIHYTKIISCLNKFYIQNKN